MNIILLKLVSKVNHWLLVVGRVVEVQLQYYILHDYFFLNKFLLTFYVEALGDNKCFSVIMSIFFFKLEKEQYFLNTARALYD